MSIAKEMVDIANVIDQRFDSIHKTHDKSLVFKWEDRAAIVSKEEFFIQVLRGVLPLASASNSNAVFNNLLIRSEDIKQSEMVELGFDIKEKMIEGTYQAPADVKGFLEPATVFTDFTIDQVLSMHTWLRQKKVGGITMSRAEEELYDRVLYILEKAGY